MTFGTILASPHGSLMYRRAGWLAELRYWEHREPVPQSREKPLGNGNRCLWVSALPGQGEGCWEGLSTRCVKTVHLEVGEVYSWHEWLLNTTPCKRAGERRPWEQATPFLAPAQISQGRKTALWLALRKSRPSTPPNGTTTAWEHFGPLDRVFSPSLPQHSRQRPQELFLSFCWHYCWLSGSCCSGCEQAEKFPV
jgi:hypothetical protein